MQRQTRVPGSCYFYYPRLVVIVGVRDEARETTNFAPVTWSTPVSSDPPLYGICLSPRTHTYELVLKTGEFTANFLSHPDAALAAALGRVSGREVDKVTAFDLQIEPGETIATPCLATAYASAECVLRDRYHLGEQTLFVGEVQLVHAQVDAFDADGVVQIDRIRPLVYLGSSVFATADAASVGRPVPLEPKK